MTYAWRRRGKTLYIPTPGSNAKMAVCGAFKWPDGPFVYRHGSKSVNSDLFIEMLGMLRMRARRTGKLVVLVIDNGSAHTSKRSRREIQSLREFINIFWLPKYSSEKLNDIENVWKHIKENYFCRMLVASREDFARMAIKLLDSLAKTGAIRKTVSAKNSKYIVGKYLVPAA